MKYFTVTCLVNEDCSHMHFNIWDCEESDVELYYPEGPFVVVYEDFEYEVCIKATDFLSAFDSGYSCIIKKIEEMKNVKSD